MEEDASSSANVPPASLKRSFSELALDSTTDDARPGSSSSATLSLMNPQTSPRRSTSSASPRSSDRCKSDAGRRSIGAAASSGHPSESAEDEQGRYKRARSASFDESSQTTSGGSAPPTSWTGAVLPVQAQSVLSPSDNRTARPSIERGEENADVIVISDEEEDFLPRVPPAGGAPGDDIIDMDTGSLYASPVPSALSDQAPSAAGTSRAQPVRPPDEPPSQESGDTRVAPEAQVYSSIDWLPLNTRSSEVIAASSVRSNSSLDSQTTRETAGDRFDEFLPVNGDDTGSATEHFTVEPPRRPRTSSEHPSAGVGRNAHSAGLSSSSRLPIGPEPTNRVSQSYLHATRLERERLRARASSPASTAARYPSLHAHPSTSPEFNRAYTAGLLGHTRSQERPRHDFAMHSDSRAQYQAARERLERIAARHDPTTDPSQIRSIMDRVGDVRQSTERLNRTIDEIRDAMADMADMADIEFPLGILDRVDDTPSAGQPPQNTRSRTPPHPPPSANRPSSPTASTGSRHELLSSTESRYDRQRPPTWLLTTSQVDLARDHDETQSSSRPPSQASSRPYLRLVPPIRPSIPTNVPPSSSAAPVPVASSPLRHTYVPETQTSLRWPHRADPMRQNSRFPFRDSVPSEPSVTDLHLARAMSHIDPMREALEDLITTGTAAPEVVQAALSLVEASHTLEQTVRRDRRAVAEVENTEWTRVRRQRENIQRALREYSQTSLLNSTAREDPPSLFFPSREPIRRDRLTDSRFPDSLPSLSEDSNSLDVLRRESMRAALAIETGWIRERRHREDIERTLNEYSQYPGSTATMREGSPPGASRDPPAGDRFPATEVWQDQAGVTRERTLYTTRAQPFPWRDPSEHAHNVQEMDPPTGANFADVEPLGLHADSSIPVPLDDDMEVEDLLDRLEAAPTPRPTAEAPLRTSGRRSRSISGAPAAPSGPSNSDRNSSGTQSGAYSTPRNIDLSAYHQGPMRSALARSVELDRRRAQLEGLRRTQSSRRPPHSTTLPETHTVGHIQLRRIGDIHSEQVPVLEEESLRLMSRFSDFGRSLRRDPATGLSLFRDRVAALARASGDSWWPTEDVLFDMYNHLPSRRGVPQSVIDNLPSGTYGEWATPGETEARCPICFEDYSPSDPLLRLPVCSHWFHKPCLLQWLKTSNTCPMCRAHVSNSSEPSDRHLHRSRTSHATRVVDSFPEFIHEQASRRSRAAGSSTRHRPPPNPLSFSAAPTPAATSTDGVARPQASTTSTRRSHAHAVSRAVGSLHDQPPPLIPVTPSSSSALHSSQPLRSPGTPPSYIWYDAIPARRNASNRHGQGSDQTRGPSGQQNREGNSEHRPGHRDDTGGEGGGSRERGPSID